MGSFWLAISVLLATLTNVAYSQSARVGESCDLGVLGVKESKDFFLFDRELRTALSKEDTEMTALLVTYPLRVGDERGSYSIGDPSSLQRRFPEVFPSEVRQIVLKQRPETVFCNYTGIAYGNGNVWVTVTNQGYVVQAVNLPDGAADNTSLPRTVKFVCRTDNARAIVDADGKGTPRYRAWNKPRSLMDKPDTEITNGREHFEGTGPCAYAMWSFTSGASEFVVEGLGCTDKRVPEGAVGQLAVSTKDKSTVTSWCF